MRLRHLVFLLPLVLLGQRPGAISNDWVHAFVANAQAGGPPGRLHKHDMNRVMIYLDEGSQRLVFQDGPTKDIPFKAGEAMWDTAGGMHTSQVTGAGNFRVVEVELKKPGGALRQTALDPAKVAPDNYKVEIDNEQVRVIRVRIPAGGAVPEHEHAGPVLIVPLTELKIEVTNADGSVDIVECTEAQLGFAEPGGRHREKNLLDKPAEVLLVEFKG